MRYLQTFFLLGPTLYASALHVRSSRIEPRRVGSIDRRWQHFSLTPEAVAPGYNVQPGNGSGAYIPTATASSTTSTVSVHFDTSATPATIAATAATTSDCPGGCQDNYMSVVCQWRNAGGFAPFSQDSTLEANAMKTSTDSTNGLEHELNPGSFAQVLAPGDDSDFESVYVGGWLCEVPSLPGLNGICSTEAQGWDHSDGETGHADILSSTKYTKIGCALSETTKVWACGKSWYSSRDRAHLILDLA